MSYKVLVVDDESEIADLIEMYLQNENYTVYKSYTAQSALLCRMQKFNYEENLTKSFIKS